jgi:hypothetical protein
MISVLLLAMSVGLLAALVSEVGYGRQLAWMPSAHHDFLAFYTAAHSAGHGLVSRVYDPAVQTSFQRQIINHPVGAAGYMPYLNPPFVAVLLSPLALLQEAPARVVWLAINSLLLIACVVYLLRDAKIPRRSLLVPLLLLVGTFPAYQALVEGQISILLLVGCVLAYGLYRGGTKLWAGVALGALWLKPQLALVALLQLLWLKQYKTAAGLVTCGVALIVLCLPITGISLNFAYLGFLANVATDHLQGAGALHPSLAWSGSLDLTEGLNGLFVSILGQKTTTIVNTLTALSDGLLVGYYLICTRRPLRGSAATSYLMIISVISALLVDPHLYAQDLVLIIVLLPALITILRSRSAGVLALTALLASVTIDQLTGFHVFTLIACSLAVLAARRIVVSPHMQESPTGSRDTSVKIAARQGLS